MGLSTVLSADYRQMNVMQVLNGLEFFERLLNLIRYAKDLVVYDGEDRLSLVFLVCFLN